MPHEHHHHGHRDHVHAVTLTGATSKGDTVTLTGQTGVAIPLPPAPAALPAPPPADTPPQVATTAGRGHGGHGHGGRGFTLAPLCSDCPSCVPCRQAGALVAGFPEQKAALAAVWAAMPTTGKAMPFLTAGALGLSVFGAMTDEPLLAIVGAIVATGGAAYTAGAYQAALDAMAANVALHKIQSTPQTLPTAATPSPALPAGMTTAGWPTFARHREL